jgi:N-acetylglutamate synthase-like GNAT family acetyltransferase
VKYLKIEIESANNSDFVYIKKLIKQFELDDRGLEQKQFLVAKQNNELIGFGRIRNHQNCDEICSIGVLEHHRRKKIASSIIKMLIVGSKKPIYLVCIQPNYFTKIGFVIKKSYPKEMEEKLNYCINELVVPEKYVVMNYVKY